MGPVKQPLFRNRRLRYCRRFHQLRPALCAAGFPRVSFSALCLAERERQNEVRDVHGQDGITGSGATVTTPVEQAPADFTVVAPALSGAITVRQDHSISSFSRPPRYQTRVADSWSAQTEALMPHSGATRADERDGTQVTY